MHSPHVPPGHTKGRGTSFRMVAEDTAEVKPPPLFRLQPERSIAECDFQLGMRSECSGGEGHVAADGTFLDSRSEAVGCRQCPGSKSSVDLAPNAPGDRPSRVRTAPDNTVAIVVGAWSGILVLGLLIGCVSVRHFQRKAALMEQFATMKLSENVQEDIDQIHGDVKHTIVSTNCEYIPELSLFSEEEPTILVL